VCGRPNGGSRTWGLEQILYRVLAVPERAFREISLFVYAELQCGEKEIKYRYTSRYSIFPHCK